MDALTSILFYFCAAGAMAGALAAATVPGVAARGYGLLLFALGVAGLLAVLSAGFAALVCLVAFAACALLLGSRRGSLAVEPPARLIYHLGAAAAALLLAGLLYVGWRADFAVGSYPGGWFGSAAVGRLFFGRDALALEAIGAILLVGLAGAGQGFRAAGRRR